MEPYHEEQQLLLMQTQVRLQTPTKWHFVILDNDGDDEEAQSAGAEGQSDMEVATTTSPAHILCTVNMPMHTQDMETCDTGQVDGNTVDQDSVVTPVASPGSGHWGVVSHRRIVRCLEKFRFTNNNLCSSSSSIAGSYWLTRFPIVAGTSETGWRESVDIHKLKLADLKQECAARGLEVKGNKQDLINRLEAYFAEHAEEDLNEEEALAEETEQVFLEEKFPCLQHKEEQKVETLSPKEETPVNKENEQTPPQKVVKISPGMSQHERLQKRAERFNVPISVESKKAARAARFGFSSGKGTSTDTKSMVPLTKLQERALRFGSNASTISEKVDEDEKLKKRKERFGILTNAAGVLEDSEVMYSISVSMPQYFVCACAH
ncbi:SAP domain-containing ribonucleoprotein [Protopterus annectens]|uniref:SAP domain-containing ribonucleoprotein n=1 Tax=Protopterus annectens TaxID=7888 RepID=UPI001CFA71FD|nr:SAP domain-containing ribonucleoprotein [Protopterus annectens]